MMEAKMKKRWIKALRSGEYEQGREDLKVDEKFCCLGVLCDISGLGSWSKGNLGESYTTGNSTLGYGSMAQDMLTIVGLSCKDEATLINLNF